MMYLNDPEISYRAKGVLACALYQRPNGRITAQAFAEHYSHPHSNSEYIFKFVKHELQRGGYMTEDPKTKELLLFANPQIPQIETI